MACGHENTVSEPVAAKENPDGTRTLTMVEYCLDCGAVLDSWTEEDDE